nr:MAG TPA: hypothetical protein [Caudoviricetes sp.]
MANFSLLTLSRYISTYAINSANPRITMSILDLLTLPADLVQSNSDK